MESPKDSYKSVSAKYFELLNRGTVDERLARALQWLGEGKREVFKEFPFGSERWDNEIMLCEAIANAVDDNRRSWHRYSSYMDHLSFLVPKLSSSDGELDREEYRKVKLRTIRFTRLLWGHTQDSLKVLRPQITANTFDRCQDLIRQIFVHLSLDSIGAGLSKVERDYRVDYNILHDKFTRSSAKVDHRIHISNIQA